MRRVPLESTISNPAYAVIGDGRMARHFAHYLKLKDLAFQNWSRNCPQKFTDFVLPHSHVLILIGDSAIENFINDHAQALKGKLLIHFSGSLSTPLANSAHPLMTFADELYDLSSYEQIPFITEKEQLTFAQLFPKLSNPSLQIAAKDKALYHSLCVAGGNFTSILWNSVLDTFKDQLDIDSDIVRPYMEQIFKNLITSPKNSLTGPLARNDMTTIHSNLRALENSELHSVYKSFLKLKNIEVPL